jgi:hypothetical protein
LACECNLVGLLTSNYEGIFSASINGSTTIEIAEDSGVVLLGQTVNNLSISAYAFPPGGDRFLGATCAASAQASIPWITKYDCANNRTYFIPKSGAKASIVNGPINNLTLECSPGIIETEFNADASGGPASPYILSDREDGFNLVYTGNPIPVETGRPQVYTIDLGFIGTIQAFLQSFSFNVNPPDVARVQYSFVFNRIN